MTILIADIAANVTINMDSDIYDEKYKRPSELKYINKDGKTAMTQQGTHNLRNKTSHSGWKRDLRTYTPARTRVYQECMCQSRTDRLISVLTLKRENRQVKR